MLTAHQQEKFEEVIDLVEKQKQPRVIIQGSAGVGKTYLAQKLIEYFLTTRKFYQKSRWVREAVYITAPTNKALSILQSKVPESPNIEFKTIHSALKLRRDINPKTGKVRFIPSHSEKGRPFDGCVLSVSDECSMLNSELADYLDDYNFPLLFLGDQKQLNPVGELSSPIFTRGYPVVELTEIVRQAEGNPIIELSRNLDLIKTRTDNLIDGKGYLFENDKNKLVEYLAEVNGTDELKYLAYTNPEVNAMNERVRRRLYGDNPAKIELGETLVFDAPKGDIYTNKEVKVESLKIITEPVLIPTAYSKYSDSYPDATDKIKMKVYRINDEFNIVHEHSQYMYNTILAALVHNCSKYSWNWKGKFFFEEQFAQTKYNHAITVHKSQGSTYKEAILNVGNIKLNRNPTETEKMLYTGGTRASDILILHNV